MIDPRILFAAVFTGMIAGTIFVGVFADLLVTILPPGRPMAVVHVVGYAVISLVAIVAYRTYKSRLPLE